MSYASQSALANEPAFQNRCMAAFTEQAQVYRNDGRADIAALANHMLTFPFQPAFGGSNIPYAFITLVAASPGFAGQVEDNEGGIDSTQVDDGELLSSVQANWPTVADLFFEDDGTPKRAPVIA